MGLWGWFTGVSDGWHTCGECHGSGETHSYISNTGGDYGAGQYSTQTCSHCRGERRIYYRNGIAYPKPPSAPVDDAPPWVK